jgi:hypothetical protein
MRESQMGPDDESRENVLAREAELIIRQIDEPLGLDELVVPFDLDEDEVASDHPAVEIIDRTIEIIRADMEFFQVADASDITIEKVRQLGHDLYYDPHTLEDLILIAKDELSTKDQDQPVPTPLKFNHIIETSNSIDIFTRLNEETMKAVDGLSIKIFGQNQERTIFVKAIESPILARKIRRFGWVLDQAFMRDFPKTVKRENVLRLYSQKLEGNIAPANLNFPDVVDLAHRTLKGMKLEADKMVLTVNPADHAEILRRITLSTDIQRAVAVCETVINGNI